MALLHAAVGLASGAAFAFVGALLLRRDVPREHKPASRAFGLAWLAGAVCAWTTAAATAGALPAMAAAWISLVFGTLLLGGAVSYLAYLLTGHRLVVRACAAAYLALLSASVAVVLALQPESAVTSGLATRFEFGATGRDHAAWLTALLFAPVVLASAGYLGLYPVAATPTARWRIALVGGGLALWSSLALAARLSEQPALGAPVRVAGALLAGAVLLAYAPPAWARRRWGVEALRAEIPPPVRSAADRAAREAQLGTRARELI